MGSKCSLNTILVLSNKLWPIASLYGVGHEPQILIPNYNIDLVLGHCFCLWMAHISPPSNLQMVDFALEYNIDLFAGHCFSLWTGAFPQGIFFFNNSPCRQTKQPAIQSSSLRKET